MQAYNYLKTLTVLLASLILWNGHLEAQSNSPLKCLEIERYDSIINSLIICRDGLAAASGYYNELQAMKQVLRDKNTLLSQYEDVAILQQRKIDSLLVIKQGYSSVVAVQKESIDLLAKPDKRFALTIGGGYGYLLDSSLKGGLVVSVQLGFKIFSF